MADFNKLTERAQGAIIAAQRIAQEHSAPEIDAEHLLLALLSDEERKRGVWTITSREARGHTVISRQGTSGSAR